MISYSKTTSQWLMMPLLSTKQMDLWRTVNMVMKMGRNMMMKVVQIMINNYRITMGITMRRTMGLDLRKDKLLLIMLNELWNRGEHHQISCLLISGFSLWPVRIRIIQHWTWSSNWLKFGTALVSRMIWFDHHAFYRWFTRSKTWSNPLWVAVSKILRLSVGSDNSISKHGESAISDLLAPWVQDPEANRVVLLCTLRSPWWCGVFSYAWWSFLWEALIFGRRSYQLQEARPLLLGRQSQNQLQCQRDEEGLRWVHLPIPEDYVSEESPKW